ncbi:LytTR family transcriptional regulator DNA-binding domain-containing protein [Oceanicaulis sp.]|uniref:LytTR family DNA-binding domain-containing protein n=2 Tax=Oceanicaulis sp. TaxID=1924941 RepID=UPI003BACFE77
MRELTPPCRSRFVNGEIRTGPMAHPVLTLARNCARPIFMVLGIGTFLAILGPFGSYTFGWPLVWLYWTGFIALGAVIGYAVGHFMPLWLPKAPEWLVYVASAMVVSIPITAAVTWVNIRAGGEGAPVNIVFVYSLVLVISGFATSVIYVVERLSKRSASQEDVPARAGAALIDKLPVKLKTAQIFSMNAEDHYLRVRTDRGDALILMRLSDAVAACEALDGARTHRSWWVARAAVEDIRKSDGRGVLVLMDGVEAPVSRTYYPALRDAGWF